MNCSKAILNLQEGHGNNLLDPEKCKKIYDELIRKRQSILLQLNVTKEIHDIGKVVSSTEEACDKSKEIFTHSKDVIDNIRTDLTYMEEIRKQFQIKFDKLQCLQTTKQYIKVVQKFGYFNTELEKEFRKRDYEKCVTLFVNLCEISRNFSDNKKSSLHDLLSEILQHWHNSFHSRFSSEFKDVLEKIKWPFVNTNFSLQGPPQSAIDKLKILTEYLLQITLPQDEDDSLSASIDIQHLCSPVSLLIQPFKKRFMFHFYGNRQTNRTDKPEWYFTQILTWIRDHREFLGKYIQPVVDKLGYYHIDAEGEFIGGLVQIAVEKLHVDISQVQFDDFSFSHTVDEALSFDKELRDSYNFPTTQVGVLGVLTQAQVFIKWLSMEKKFATEKVDTILSSSLKEPFTLLTSNDDALKITVCADAFMTLLKRITDRYESLPQPGHRLQFLQLQLDLLDDFRVRLIQIANAEEGDVVESRVPMIANTLFYMENVLIDWGNTLHYLNLFYHKKNLESIEMSNSLLDFNNPIIGYESENVFSEILSLYGHMRHDLISTLSECIINDVKNKSRNYRKEEWFKMNVQKDTKTCSLTPSACPMFEVISKRLYQLQKTLSNKLFFSVWKSIAQQLDIFLFENLVLDNKFDGSGATQFKFDIQMCLLPLFSQYTEKPSVHFTQLLESINLLNLAEGTAILLRESLIQLDDATGVEDTKGKMLKDVGIKHFSPRMVVNILNHRMDITTDKLIID